MKHLPGGPQSMLLNPNADYCGQAGAAILCARIQAYWAARGKQVSVFSVRRWNGLEGGNQSYDVRSEMTGGQP